jgi:hypothetical protein
MKYEDLATDVLELFGEAQHLSQRPAWVGVLDWASIRGSRPAGMSARASPAPKPRHARSRRRRRLPSARACAARHSVRLAPPIVRLAPPIVRADAVAGATPSITRTACGICGGVLEMREGSDRIIHLGKRAGGLGICGTGSASIEAAAAFDGAKVIRFAEVLLGASPSPERP